MAVPMNVSIPGGIPVFRQRRTLPAVEALRLSDVAHQEGWYTTWEKEIRPVNKLIVISTCMDH